MTALLLSDASLSPYHSDPCTPFDPANTGSCSNDGSMLGQRLRRWPSNDPSFVCCESVVVMDKAYVQLSSRQPGSGTHLGSGRHSVGQYRIRIDTR